MSEHVEHLVVAILAVGGFSLQRAWDLLPLLREQGLTNPEIVEQLDCNEVVRRLELCGYDRGLMVTTEQAKRLIAAHAAVREGVLSVAVRQLQEGRLEEAEQSLRGIKGVGPVVFQGFVLLEGTTP